MGSMLPRPFALVLPLVNRTARPFRIMSLRRRILLLMFAYGALTTVGAIWAIRAAPLDPGPVAAAAGVLILLAGLGTAWCLSGLRRGMVRLDEAAAQLGGSAPLTASSTGVPEFDRAAEALRQADARLRQAQLEAEARASEATREIHAARTQLDQRAKMEAVGQLTRGMAHDFNNLLQTLNMGLQVLDRRVEDPQSRTMIDACLRAAFRARTLIEQLQAFSKRQPLQPVPVDMHDLLLKMEQLLTKALPPNISLHFNLHSDLWPTRTDPGQFELALLNLLFNARDAMPHGGRIVVSAYNARNTEAGDVVCIEVADVGSGIDPAVLPHVFDAFFTTKNKGQGAGLGLAQVYNLASGSGGDVAIESAPQVGTVVRVTLPKADEMPARAAPRTYAPVGSEPIRVLFVEDDPLVSKVAASALTGLGFDVLHVASADEALKQLEDGERIEAVFSDVVMPGRMSGLDLAEQLTRRWPTLPVVLASGYGEKAPPHLNVRVLAKPYLIEDVAQALHDAREQTP